MKRIVFYFTDGSFKSVFGYGNNNHECIKDAENDLTEYQIKDIVSVSVFTPLQSEL